jgi:hypothetical protein
MKICRGNPNLFKTGQKYQALLRIISYQGADKSLAQPISRCILFDGENISFDASLAIYIKSINIPAIMIINRIRTSKSSVAVVCFLPGRAKNLSAQLYIYTVDTSTKYLVDKHEKWNPLL